MNQELLRSSERLLLKLRESFERCGYLPYRMSRFEEYDLYAQNREFLSSDGVIAFTDTNGKLMALKPDVTLSIVRGGRDEPDAVQRLYYDESVFRVSRRTGTFQEITQTGLECIGPIDGYCRSEVVGLACKALEAVSRRWVLQVSHLGILSHFIRALDLSEEAREQVFSLIREKNRHELAALCAEKGVPFSAAGRLEALLSLSGDAADILPRLRALGCPKGPLGELETLRRDLSDLPIRVDFSVVNDMRYYNGLVFQGFVGGVPESVLSGGQYDGLMRKLKRRAGAVGFALNLDPLERLWRDPSPVPDVILLCDTEDGLYAAAARLREQGLRVSVQKTPPEETSPARLARWNGSEVIWL